MSVPHLRLVPPYVDPKLTMAEANRRRQLEAHPPHPEIVQLASQAGLWLSPLAIEGLRPGIIKRTLLYSTFDSHEWLRAILKRELRRQAAEADAKAWS